MKRDRHSGIQWNRVLRRSAALLMVTAALWALLTAAGAGAAAEAFKALGEDGGFVSAILRAELGEVEGAGGPFDALDRWGQLVVGQSSLLRSNEEAVAQWLAGETGGDGTENDGQEKPAEPSPTPEAEDPEDPANLPEVTTAPDDIIAHTLVPSAGVGYAQADGVYIYNTTDVAVDAAALASAQVNITLGDPAEPQILIMHTHATEAYTPDGTDIYVQTDNSRTLDNTQNMVRIGEEMKEVFEEMGLSVIHDETPYDYPQYNGAYSRSGAGVEEYLKQYPSIKIVLDVHRDALIGEDGTVYKPLTTVDGQDTAQVMLVMGSPEAGDYPAWMENLTLAMKIQKSMNTLYPTLARPITIRGSSVYNQELTNGSLLVEVGAHGNTIQEAIRGARLFARAAGQVLLELEG